ncbi:MAG TPA: ABC transporter ATP-binding protein [Burkholderiales bacterium]|nr:ABC transporter ATP-binding protein [Burkholderiales bacterium]
MSAREALGYHAGGIETVISVEEVNRQAGRLREPVSVERLAALARNDPHLELDELTAGYGRMEVLYGFNLKVARGQSLCLIGPNGAGKSTVLHSIYGFTRIFGGAIRVGPNGVTADITHSSPNEKLGRSGIAYILQDKSIFPDMTVEENLWMGGYLLPSRALARERAEKVFERYERLAARRRHPARVLSGGERRLLEISRALVMEPDILLVDEPSIGLEPRFIDMVFGILQDLQREEGKTIVMVEQNAKRGLEFADIGYVLVSGELVMAAPGRELLENPEVGRLFLGG